MAEPATSRQATTATAGDSRRTLMSSLLRSFPRVDGNRMNLRRRADVGSDVLRRVSCREYRNAPEPSQAVTDGHVIIIGGAEDKIRDRVILSRFATLAGGRDGTVVVIST